MKKPIIFAIALLFLLPARSDAIRRVTINIVSGHVGYPMHYGITAFLGMRAFPIKGNSLFARIGFDYNIFREEHFTYGDDDDKYVSTIMLPFQFMILLYPSNIGIVDSKNPIYTYLYAGGAPTAYAHKDIEEAHTWGSTNAMFWNGGIGISFKSIIDIHVGYTSIHIDDQLGVDAYGNFVEYIPAIEYYRFDASIKLNLGSAIIDWIKPGLLD
jgi:hypothetical protein